MNARALDHAALALLVACSGPGSGPEQNLPLPEGDPSTVELAGDCPMDTRVGSFTVGDFEKYTIVDGSVANGVVPVTILDETMASGDCRLLLRHNLFCEGGCEQAETCDFDGTCVPYPEAIDLGPVTLAGLVRDVSMDPVQPGARYFDTSLPHPAMTAGALLQLRTEGGPLGPFDLHGIGVAGLELDGAAWVLDRGQDLTVRWSPAPGRSHVRMEVRIDQHGISPSTLVCDFDDDGEGSAPAAIVDALIDAGVTGFPNGTLSRRTVDQATVPGGCVDLVTQSVRNPDVRVSGFIPCDEPSDCPDGLDCNLQTQLCE